MKPTELELTGADMDAASQLLAEMAERMTAFTATVDEMARLMAGDDAARGAEPADRSRLSSPPPFCGAGQ